MCSSTDLELETWRLSTISLPACISKIEADIPKSEEGAKNVFKNEYMHLDLNFSCEKYDLRTNMLLEF